MLLQGMLLNITANVEKPISIFKALNLLKNLPLS